MKILYDKDHIAGDGKKYSVHYGKDGIFFFISVVNARYTNKEDELMFTISSDKLIPDIANLMLNWGITLEELTVLKSLK